MFKTYDNDIDGITNKLGFSKRSFAEWGEQVSKAFAESEGKMNKFKNTMNAAFVPQTGKNNALIEEFNDFIFLMNDEGLTAKETAEILGNDLSPEIQRYVKNSKDGKITTDGFKNSIGEMSIGAKAGKIALQGLALVGNALAMAFASWVATEIISWLNDLAHAEENARKRSEELTSSYETEKQNIDDSIAKYKELSEKLNDSSLSTSEVKSIKEQLLSVQDQLNEKYGAEATQIDLVNGKYDEQIEKLDKLSKKKAGDYVAENYKDIQADQKYVSEKVNLNKSLGFKGSQARPDDYSNAGFDLKKYLDRYDKLSAKVVNPDGQYGMTGDVNLVTNGTRQEIYDQLSKLFRDLKNDFGNSNEDVNRFKTTISGILEDSFDTDALDSANDRIKKYTQAEILSNDNASTSYSNLVDAVDNYNTALSSGKGVDDAKKKLVETKQAAEDSTKDITNSGKVLQDVYNSLSNEAPIEFQIKIGKDVDEDLKKSYEDTINRFKDSGKIKDFFGTEGINTQEEIDYFNDVTKNAKTAEDAIKAYTVAKKEEKKTPSSFLDIWNSSVFSESKKKLLELAKSGELTSETLKSTEDYKKILDETGNSAEDTKNKIYELLTAQEKLAGASNGINNLSSAYKEFEEKGFVTAQTIEALPDVFKKLESYDLFTKIIGNPKNGTDKIKQAFNQIVQEYLNYTKVFNSEDLYSDNVEIQQNAIETYIANLKSIGITNAEEVVNQTVNSVKQQRTLFNEAEQEYINYLNNKDGVTLEYIESTASKNSQLMQSFGEGYQDDYNNWIELLKKKQEAYQALVAALNGEYDPTESIVGNLLKNGKEVTASAIVAGEEARAAYERAMKKYDDYKNSFSLNFTPTNFDASYTSPDGSSSSSSKTDAYKQAFDDWYEALKHQLAMGQITEAQYYKELDKKNKEYFANKKEYLSEYRQYEEEVYKGLRSLQDNALNSIHNLIDLRKEMIKDMKQDEIDAINKVIEKEKKKLEAINESIDARKKAIELLKDERTHEEEMADKNKAISDIQSKIDALKYDNSASAQKKRRELEEELTDAKKELADYISDYEYDKAVDALDKESDAAQEKYDKEEERLQNQIDKIQEYINNQKLLTQDALNDINGLNQSLFEKMKKWALDTKGEVYDVVDAWNEARKALELYNGVNRVPQVHDTLHKNAASQNGVTPIGNLGSKNTNKNNSNTSSGNSNNNNKSGYKAVHTIVKNDTLWVLAQKYYGDGSKWTKIQQANGNINPNYLPIGKKLYIPYKKGTKKVPENQLALTDELGEELILHANEKGTLRNLTKGSSVIPADITENLMSWGNFNPDMFIKNLTPTLPNITSVSNSKANTPAINIGDININGNMGNLTKSDLNNFRKEIVNDVYDNIQRNRVKNGRY